MILRAFCVHDVKADLYNAPFFVPTRAQAERAFAGIVNDPQTELAKYPDDFRLVAVGVFNDQVGEMVPSKPELVCFASSVKRVEAQLPLPVPMRPSDG